MRTLGNNREEKGIIGKKRDLKKANPFLPYCSFLFPVIPSSQGSVLIATIWILLILSIFTVVVNRRASQELLLGRWTREQVNTRLLAKAGVERGLFEIQSDKFLVFDALNDSWANNKDAFKQIPLAGGNFSVVCDFRGEGKEPEENPLPGKAKDEDESSYGVCDESGRLNINYVDQETLIQFFIAVVDKMDQTSALRIAQSILDWRDTDDGALPSGAEANFYHFGSYPYDPRNEKFESVEELSMVRGITPEIYKKVAPYLTVYTKGKVNFNTAPKQVLQGLGLSLGLAQKLIDFRKGPDGVQGTLDDEVFQSTEGIAPQLSVAGSFSGEEFQQISNAVSRGMATVKSSVFRIQSIGRILRNSQKIEMVATCVIKRNGNILYWNEKNRAEAI